MNLTPSANRTLTWIAGACACLPLACIDDGPTSSRSNTDAHTDGGTQHDDQEDAGPQETSAAHLGGMDGVVSLKLGKVQGDLVTDGVRRNVKIPYAKPPVGELRCWKQPEPPEPWTGVRHETQLSEACAQNASSGSKASLNEDCLYLHVWATNDKVPMTDQLWFDGQVFAKRHGTVLVTTNYSRRRVIRTARTCPPTGPHSNPLRMTTTSDSNST